MTPAAILALLEGVLGAAPALLSLYQQAVGGKAVTQSQVSQVLSTYGVDRAVFAAAIAQAEAVQAAANAVHATPAAAPTLKPSA